ncbi:MAG: DUF6273 domain-containing protein, partial [Treponema sp.]|nr:DUF6273 domain-containing protein [Treponema sp.]
WHGYVVNADEESIKDKFGIETSDKDGVTETFEMLHYFIKMGGLTDRPDVIKLGDSIDLASLTVDGANITKLKLIVVGINSFHLGRGGGEGKYAVTANDKVPHVVLQFEVSTGSRGMNTDATNVGGYAGSEMRQYLIDKFLPGLVAAGVPEELMWAPLRYVSDKGSGDGTVQDLLWLPTEWEILGGRSNSESNYETAANQAWLEYYTTNTKRQKGGTYWLGSPASGDSNFCATVNNGSLTTSSASTVQGVIPAFCIGYKPAP